MSNTNRVPREVLDATRAITVKAEPITLRDAIAAIREEAPKQCSPAVTALLRRLVTMNIAGLLDARLAVNLCDVGRELRAARENEVEPRP